MKQTNPKELAAVTRVPLASLSPIASAHWAAAQYAGMLKYGAWNWRAAGVSYMTYLSAIKRHADALISGETFDPVDGTRHEGNIMACAAILLEALAAGMVTDDRPPVVDHRPAYAEVEAIMGKLYQQYKDVHPKHWTINDVIEGRDGVHPVGAPAPAAGATRLLARKEQQPVPRRNR